jgi:hypothetical protein
MREGELERIKEEILQIQKENISCCEENTKQWLIIPFVQSLGYNTANRKDLVCEMPADLREKGTEKVDYAILINNKPIIIIEAKALGEDLRLSVGQLKRYYASSNLIKYGILTNGRQYWFFEDRKSVNMMDDEPFYSIDLLNLTERDLEFLDFFSKEKFKEIYPEFESFKINKILKDFIQKNILTPSERIIEYICESLNLEKGRQEVRDMILTNLNGNAFRSKEERREEREEENAREPQILAGKSVKVRIGTSELAKKSWRELQRIVCEKLISESENAEKKLIEFAKKYNTKKRMWFTKNKESIPKYISNPTLLSNNFYVYNNLSADSIRKFIRDIVLFFGYECEPVEFTD